MRRAAIALALSLVLVPGMPAFDIIECDGDSTTGDAAALKGWNLALGPLGSIRVDMRGAPTSSLTTAQVFDLWDRAQQDWSAVPNLNAAFAFGPLNPVISTPFQLGATFLNGNNAPPAAPDGSDGVRNWLVVNKDTQMVRGGAVSTGWVGITGTDPTAVLGICYLRWNNATLFLEDSEIVINDDDSDGGLGGSYVQGRPGDPAPGPAQYSMYSVAVHEIGHFLAIAHSREMTAIMFPSLTPGVIQTLDPSDDFGAIQFLYPAAGFTPPLPDAINFAAPLCAPGLIPPTAFFNSGRPTKGCNFSPDGPAHVLPVLVFLVLGLARVVASRT